MTLHNPVTGVGLNTFVDQLPPYDPAQTSRLKAYPVHDIFLLESSETGLGGGVAFLSLAVLMIQKAFSYAREMPIAYPPLVWPGAFCSDRLLLGSRPVRLHVPATSISGSGLGHACARVCELRN